MGLHFYVKVGFLWGNSKYFSISILFRNKLVLLQQEL